jgi:transposase-like protein
MMKFSNIEEIVLAVNTIREAKSTVRTHYPVLFKKAVCEFIELFSNANAVASATGIARCTVYNWVEQFNCGLYTLEGAYSVSKKSLSLNSKLIAELEQEIKDIDVKIALIKKCNDMGLNVTSN